MIRLTFSLLSLSARLALALFFIVGLAFLGVRYALLPNIDSWRPQLQAVVSRALDTQVQIGRLQADWSGLNPSFELDNVQLSQPDGRTVLTVPRLRAVLSWRSLLALEPQFVRLAVESIELDIQRDAQGRIWVLGQPLELRSTEPIEAGEQQHFIHWLLIQRNVVVSNATVRWTDQTRGDQPLELSGVSLNVSGAPGRHTVQLQATPPAALATALDIRGELLGTSLNEQGKFTLKGSHARFYAKVDNLKPTGWKPWVDMPQNLVSGEVSAQFWLDVQETRPVRAASDVQVQGGLWTFDTLARVGVDRARIFLDGDWQSVLRFAGKEADPLEPDATTSGRAPELKYVVDLQGAHARLPDAFTQEVVLDTVRSSGRLNRARGAYFGVEFDELALVNADIQAQLKGSWRQGGDGEEGVADITGTLAYLDIDAIDDYLPLTVDHDAREWMAKGLKSGAVRNGSLELQGDLFHFPFQSRPDQGRFLVQGDYDGLTIDYVPAEKNALGWPPIQNLHGRVRMERADLQLTAPSALLAVGPDKTLQVQNIQARIPNVEQDSVLSITGETRGQAASYLALMTLSPLGELLDHVFDQATGTGEWQVPIQLTIPLLDTDATQVRGGIRFDDAGVQLMPELPLITGLAGTLHFSETSVRAEALRGSALGGALTINGEIGGAGKGFTVRGRLTSQALHDYAGVRGMQRLQGAADYVLWLDQDKRNDLLVRLESDLKGMALTLPEPLGKSADGAMKLAARWERLGRRSMGLRVQVDDTLSVVLARPDAGTGKGSYFSSGAVGVNKQPKLPDTGLMLDIQTPRFDADAWNTVVDEFSTSSGKAGEPVPLLLPPVAYVRVQADEALAYGTTLDHFTFTANRSDAQQWRVDISSSPVAGTLFWREANGKVAGRVDAKFDRLTLGRAPETPDTPDAPAAQKTPEDPSPAMESDARLDIPGINLYVKNLTLYGQHVGELTLMGLNQARGRRWRLDELIVSSPAAVLRGTGVWQLDGPGRGLTLDATADIKDMGAYLNQLGHTGIMEGGQGRLSANIEWRNLPWSFSRADLNGELQFDLSKGRFSSVNSRTARLLEVLSLQSVRRLASLDFRPGKLLENGFPYDTLGGTVQLQQGVLRTRDYRVSGPAATIVLEGDVSLVNETLNLDAVVVPNLDVSGAAVAAGIAVNPIVGIGAFLGQLLLQRPLAKAMTVQYHVSGGWDDPQVKEVPVSADGRDDSQKKRP